MASLLFKCIAVVLKEGILKSLLPPAISMSLIVSVGVFAAFFILERIFPRIIFDGNKRSRLVNNFGLGITYKLLFSPMVIAPLVLYIVRDVPYRLHRPDWYHGVLAVVIDFMILDLTHFLQHMLAHRIPLLWRFHAVHHIDEHLDVTTGIRNHFAEKFFALATKLPVLFLLAVPPETVGAYEAFVFCYGVFHHSNIRLPDRLEQWLGKVLVTPLYHNIHHGRTQNFTDSNYGAILSVWDYFTGTRCAVTRRPPGFTNGLDEHPDYSLAGLHLLPLLPISVKHWGDVWFGGKRRRSGQRDIRIQPHP